ncbi:MAG: hypothetical protein IPM97_05465 [Bdellovibrionaceae bacterium]|nr:hypothetical protein [Pseudobdellovibrionaceae bacterium]
MTLLSKIQPKRGKEVLRLVRNHGPISIDMLQKMTQPEMSKKNLRKSLQVLRTKHLIDSLNANYQTTYYQISQSLPSRLASAQILGLTTEEIVRPLLRRQDWFHNQWCEYWALSIKRQFPEAEIVREHSIGSHAVAQRVLQLQQRDFDLMPDFLLIFPKTETSEATYIAFEIERTRKSDKRILRKFRKYLNGTKIDGLIYICDSGRLSETIRLLYQTKLQEQSHRVKHYGDHFFLFADSLEGGGPTLARLFNAKTQQVSFNNWCGYLLSTKWTKRRDENFK